MPFAYLPQAVTAGGMGGRGVETSWASLATVRQHLSRVQTLLFFLSFAENLSALFACLVIFQEA